MTLQPINISLLKEVRKILPKDLLNIAYEYLYDFETNKNKVINDLNMQTILINNKDSLDYINLLYEHKHNYRNSYGIPKYFIRTPKDLNFTIGFCYMEDFTKSLGVKEIVLNLDYICYCNNEDELAISGKDKYEDLELRIIKNKHDILVVDILLALKRIGYTKLCDHTFFEKVYKGKDGRYEIFWTS